MLLATVEHSHGQCGRNYLDTVSQAVSKRDSSSRVNGTVADGESFGRLRLRAGLSLIQRV
jgi:hypothetical protein